MDEKELQLFIEWLPKSGIEDYKDKSPEEVATLLNKKSKEKDGDQYIQSLIDEYQSSKSNPKQDYLSNLYKKGGKLKKCKCGCTLKKVMEKGGIVEKCSCGCKGVEKKQSGGPLKNPLPTPKPNKLEIPFHKDYKELKAIKESLEYKNERLAAKKAKSEFFAVKDIKFDTESGEPIMRMK